VFQERLEGVAEDLAALIESGLDKEPEERFVAREVGTLIAGEPYDGTFDFRGRREDVFVDGEEVLDMIPSLYQDAGDAVDTASVCGCESEGCFFLNHAGATRDGVPMFKEFEKDL
jgi:hypothetical protein